MSEVVVIGRLAVLRSLVLARGGNLHLKLTTMDVPFLSSGAMSRAHYALVRNVEDATSPPMADQYLLEEVENIRSRLSRPTSAVGNIEVSC